MSEILKGFKVVAVEGEPFNIPNTQINIWKLKAEVDGKRDIYSTMSKALATEGFMGDVEFYTNDNGKDYVRQAPKEDKIGGTSGGYQDHSLGMAWGNALTNAVTTVGLVEKVGSAKLETIREKVLETAQYYFDNRPDAGVEKEVQKEVEDRNDDSAKGEMVLDDDLPALTEDDIPDDWK